MTLTDKVEQITNQLVQTLDNINVSGQKLVGFTAATNDIVESYKFSKDSRDLEQLIEFLVYLSIETKDISYQIRDKI